MPVMSQPALATRFASPERLNHEKHSWLHGLLRKDHGLSILIDAMPELVMVLGETRQILLGNRAMRDFAEAQGTPDFLGMRPGEFLACQHAATAPSGCGTGDACSNCGAVESILAAFSGNHASHECRVFRTTAEGVVPLDLKVWATPLRWHGMSLVLLVAVDISDEKRRKAMELIFFPGILDNDGAISSLSKFLFNGIMTLDNDKEPLLESAQALVTEIRAQMELLAAENSELTMKPASV